MNGYLRERRKSLMLHQLVSLISAILVISCYFPNQHVIHWLKATTTTRLLKILHLRQCSKKESSLTSAPCGLGWGGCSEAGGSTSEMASWNTGSQLRAQLLAMSCFSSMGLFPTWLGFSQRDR